MAFVNEEISKEQHEVYNIKEIDARLGFGTPIMDWTIDKERDIWLRLCYKHMSMESTISAMWNFYWKSVQFTVFIKQPPLPQQKVGIENYAYIKILDFYIGDKYRHRDINSFSPDGLPREIAYQKRQILREFKEALEISNVGLGIASTTGKYTIDLIYEEKLI
ncbi:MAG: hypothetical protein LBH45_06310 [Campylobacteraceae bacterium]|nr:hypothetical protein [Campylobacteraceae bacterium]